MSLLFLESCDGYSTHADINTQRRTILSNADLNLTGGRYGGGAIIPRTLNTGDTFPMNAAPAANLMRWAFHMKANLSAPSATGDRPIIRFQNLANTRVIRMFITATGKMNISKFDDTSTATLLGAGTLTVMDNAWHHVEVEMTAHTSTGVLKMWVDGILDTFYNIVGDTSDAASLDMTALTHVQMGGCNSNTGGDVDAFYDDLIVWDDSNGGLTGHLPDQHRCITTTVSANGANGVDWTPSTGANWQNIDDTAYDGDTTYNESGVPGDTDYFDISSIGFTPTYVYACVPEYVVRASDLGVRTVRGKIDSAGSIASGSSHQLSGEYRKFQDFIEQDPNSAAPWTPSDILTLQFGIEVVT